MLVRIQHRVMLGQLNLNSIIMVALLNVIVALVYVGFIYGDSGDGSGGEVTYLMGITME